MMAFGIPRTSGRVVFAGILLFGLLAMTARNAVDPDLWWHLRTGQWIVETGHVPHFDPFSFTRAGHAWVSHEWLSETVFYELWKHGGPAALIVFSAMVTTAGFMLLYLRCLRYGVKPYWAAAATVLGALAAAPSWGARPQMFTFTLASLLLWLVERGEARPKILFWIPPLFLLWLNLHAGFALGAALLLAYGAGLIVETAFGNTPWHEARPILLRVLLLLLAGLALVPLNPSGAHLYRYPFDTLRSSAMRSLIGEWHSPDFHGWLYRPFLLVWLLLLAALASRSCGSGALPRLDGAKPRPHTKGRVLALLLLTACAALDAVRHIPIFILLAMPVIAGALAGDRSDHDGKSHVSKNARRGAPVFSHFRPIFNGAVVLLLAVFTLVRWVSLVRGQDAREAEQYPQKAVAFLRASDSPQNIFVYYDWGGYAIWKLYPKYRVFVDGRADLYGDDLLRQFKTAVDLRTGWQGVLERWNVEAVLVPTTCALAQALLLDPNWHTGFSDSKAILLLRTVAVVENAGVSPGPMVQEPVAAGARR
jgi:hypothetical protein